MSAIRIVIAGGHGKIAMLLARQLVAAGHDCVGIIRASAHIPDLARAGIEPVLMDLEHATVQEVAHVLGGADAAVFAAGAGYGSGIPRKDTVDRGAAVLTARSAERAGVPLFLQLSGLGAFTASSPGATDSFRACVIAKRRAEADLSTRELNWIILRLGVLTDDPPTGMVTLARSALPVGPVSRADTATTCAALLVQPPHRVTLELTRGSTPIDQAVAALNGDPHDDLVV